MTYKILGRIIKQMRASLNLNPTIRSFYIICRKKLEPYFSPISHLRTLTRNCAEILKLFLLGDEEQRDHKIRFSHFVDLILWRPKKEQMAETSSLKWVENIEKILDTGKTPGKDSSCVEILKSGSENKLHCLT